MPQLRPPFPATSLRFSTAVMDFLAQPVHEPSTPPKHILGVKYPDNSSADVDVRSWDGSDASACDDSDDDFIARRAGADSRRAYSSHRRLLAAGSGGGKAKVAVNDPKAAGEAVAGAALAAEYGLWLKRLAVRLRRSTPAGERFVRLRRIGPAVTGEQVSGDGELLCRRQSSMMWSLFGGDEQRTHVT